MEKNMTRRSFFASLFAAVAAPFAPASGDVQPIVAYWVSWGVDDKTTEVTHFRRRGGRKRGFADFEYMTQAEIWRRLQAAALRPEPLRVAFAEVKQCATVGRKEKGPCSAADATPVQ